MVEGGWQIKKILDLHATNMSLGSSEVLFVLDFDLSLAEAYVSTVRREHRVVEDYFYVVTVDFGLRFPFPELW